MKRREEHWGFKERKAEGVKQKPCICRAFCDILIVNNSNYDRYDKNVRKEGLGCLIL